MIKISFVVMKQDGEMDATVVAAQDDTAAWNWLCNHPRFRGTKILRINHLEEVSDQFMCPSTKVSQAYCYCDQCQTRETPRTPQRLYVLIDEQDPATVLGVYSTHEKREVAKAEVIKHDPTANKLLHQFDLLIDTTYDL